jgi:hypothetical protein
MDPQSIPGAIQSLLAMTDTKMAEAIVKQPFGASTNIPPSLRNLPEIKPFNPPSDSEKAAPNGKEKPQENV